MAELRPAARLERECRVFGGYLLGREMNPYVLGKYAQAHETLAWENAPGFFDRLLTGLAARHALATKICDAYARFFSPQCVLRKKLVLLLAILELTPPYYRDIDAVAARSRLMLFAAVVGKGATLAFCLVLAVPVLLPLQLLSKVAAGRRAAGG
jgi:hypothetical protein